MSKDPATMSIEVLDKDDGSLGGSDSESTTRGFESSRRTSEESTSSHDKSSEMSPSLSAKESQQVLRSKILMYIVLLVSAITVAGFTYHFLTQEEDNNFETQFTDLSTEIIVSTDMNAKTYLGKLESLSDIIMASAAGTDSAWPNVTLPNFDILTTESFEQFIGPELYLFAPIVSEDNRRGWEQYAQDNQGWIREDLFFRGLQNINPGPIPDEIYTNSGDDVSNNDFHVPIWQVAPVPTNAEIVLLDLYTESSFRRMIDDAITVRHILLSEIVDSTFISNSIETLNKNPQRQNQPRSYAVQPIFEKFSPNQDAAIAGFVFSVVPWDTYFSGILPPGSNGFIVQVVDTCGTNFTYRLDGPDAVFLEDGFIPDPKFDYLVQTTEFATFARFDENKKTDGVLYCSYSFSVHATAEYEDEFKTNKPLWVTIIVVMVFVFTALVFVMYDYFVQRRQNKVLNTAQRTIAIITSLFPKSVITKMMESDQELKTTQISGKDRLRSFFDGKSNGDESRDNPDGLKKGEAGQIFKTKPIADFFPETTVMFGDIVGFTAWSSTREPSQVFTLLETIYHEFDQIAKSRRVFKVETVGDCYVAVAGLPDPRKDHATIMARFARECLSTLSRLLRQLEVALGPDTADLTMRIGLHSGPVTAGVLRGDRARFQLFGDTMNMASRMESTGTPNRIQVSATFAEYIKKANRSNWITPREDLVNVKGKGRLQTYWLDFNGDNLLRMDETESTSYSEEGSQDFTERSSCLFEENEFKAQVTELVGGTEKVEGRLSQKAERLVEWNVDLLITILKQIVAQRESTGVVPDSDQRLTKIEIETKDVRLDEVQEIISIPDYRRGRQCDPESIRIDTKVVEQLHIFILKIARMYHQNPFHNFEHASHVTMSVVKLLARIVAPDMSNLGEQKMNVRGLYDHTYGITNDPIIQFSVVISALIHDTDHPGVPNNQLIKEMDPRAKKYHEKSVAEQNSVDLAWSLLMTDEFKELRRTIYKTEREFRRFRHLVVNSVLATDIMDKDLVKLRNNRWDKAFKVETEESCRDKKNRKATIVIEHLIQASDVAHTMQHWHIYRKWNSRLFEEMYKAYVEGRAEKDPSEFWYQGEIGFLDFYVIPLAKKLKSCGVFGVSSDEYLQYAENNRREWEEKGKEVVEELIEKVKGNPKYQKLVAQKLIASGLLTTETQHKTVSSKPRRRLSLSLS